MSHAIPLIISISLVYAATRHEDMKEILLHAGRSAVWIVCFMAIVLGVLWLLDPG